MNDTSLNAGALLEVMARWNRWGRARLDPGVPRQIAARAAEHLAGREVLALVGPRRAGKTTVLYQLMEELERRGRPRESCLHVNFEEPALAVDLGVDLLERLYTVYREEIHPEGRAYLFLDEIQSVPGWERWVRARNESEDVKVIVTGSSSELLSRELGTRLTGRHLTLRVLPLSFAEYLQFKDIPLPPRPRTAGYPPRLQRALKDYLRWGGFPEVVLAGDERRRSLLLRQYFDDIVYRDVALRHNVRDLTTLRALAVHLLTNSSGTFSYQRLGRLLGVSLDMVRSYCAFLEEAFLIAMLPHHSLKASERQRNPQKVHCLDVGLRNEVALSASPDLGKLAESAVFLALLAGEHDGIFYWRGGREVDLAVRRGNQVARLIQVAFDGLGRPEVAARELGALEDARRVFPRARRTLVVGSQAGWTGEVPKGVEVVPLWRFLALGS